MAATRKRQDEPKMRTRGLVAAMAALVRGLAEQIEEKRKNGWLGHAVASNGWSR